MSQATMTMWGIANYDNTILDSFHFPTGIDKDIAINTIMVTCGDYEVMYPNADFLKFAIDNWCKKYTRTFEKWVNALNIDYNPLENYDRFEDYTDTTSHSNTENVTRSDTTTGNATTSNTTSATTSDTTNTSKSSFDSDTLQVTDSNTGNGTNSSTGSSSADTSNVTNGTTNTQGSDSGTSTHTAHLHGNIGVVSSQEMLKNELSIAEWCLYDKIANKFASDFVLAIL